MASPPQASKGCPNCGSRRFKFAPSKPSSGPAAESLFSMRDRVCKDCGTQYTPPMPGWMPYMIMVTGVALALAGVALMFEGMKGPVKFRLWVKIAMVVGGLVVAFAGVRLARKKKP